MRKERRKVRRVKNSGNFFCFLISPSMTSMLATLTRQMVVHDRND